MLSSAPPPTPAVIDVVPILSWKDNGELATGRTSIRHGVGLRVWLRRPWFASGAGELLGVVCRNDGIVGTNSPEYREITYIARDPAHGGIVPHPLGTDSLAGAAVRVESITVQTSGGPATASLAGFKPRYDRGRDAWYCDLKFDTGMAYLPFVRLGLVRYQPKSIPGCEASHFIATSFVQTLPDRTLTVIRQNDTLTVRMHGPAPQSRRKYDGTVVEDTNVVAAVIEEQDPRVRDVALGWLALGPETILTAEIAEDGSAVWSGGVPVSDAELGGVRRLCVREFELHPADDRNAGAPAGTLVEGRRLVHADVIALDA